MSQVLKAPPKFLPSDWSHAIHVHLRSAEAERGRSERLTAECKRLMEESERSVRRMQQDAKNRLEWRLQDVKFWRQELEQKHHSTVQEIELLLMIKDRVERALASCAEPLQATLECLNERQKRVDIDLVHDEVENELLKEKDVIEGVATLLRRTLEQIVEQIRLNRSVKYYLEKDLRDKFQAERIDNFCSMLSSTTASVEEQTTASVEEQTGAGRCADGGLAVTPQEWETFSDVNICKAEKERNNSASLRALVENLLAQTAADMQRQHEAAGSALTRRIHETRSAKVGLEDQLSKLLVEIASQEQNLDALKVSVADKEVPLKMAQTHLHARSQRPRVELCNDPAYTRLLSEVQQLMRHISRLKDRLSKSEMELRALTRSQLLLEEEIQVKSNSLYIDEVICTQIRQPVAIHDF